MNTQSELAGELKKSLQALRGQSKQIVGAFIINTQGELVAADFAAPYDEDVVAGMAGSLLGLGERVLADLLNVDFEQASLAGKLGHVVLHNLGKGSALMVLSHQPPAADLVPQTFKTEIAGMIAGH
jgi:predicted regulator of Ras-like GTPase activity (Roadblock/LC7/MglB family)